MQSSGSYALDVVAEEIARLWSAVIALSITSDSLSEIVDDSLEGPGRICYRRSRFLSNSQDIERVFHGSSCVAAEP